MQAPSAAIAHAPHVVLHGTMRSPPLPVVCAVANFTVYDAQGTPVYDIHQPTCCGGTCVNCCDKDGAGCCRVPFFIYPSGGDEQSRSGKITKVWLGMKKEVSAATATAFTAAVFLCSPLCSGCSA